jgi:Fe-S cluster biosynthesis and repair protein YggX
MSALIHCRRCDDEVPGLEKPPFKNELGEQIVSQICNSCWKEWLQHQTVLINHYGLDPRDAKARAFLYEQIEQVLLGDEEGEGVDTSKQGSIEW